MLTVLTQTSEAVNCMTAENTVSRSELAQAAGMFRPPFVIPRAPGSPCGWP